MKKASKAIAFAMASAMAVSMAACGGSASSTASGAASGDSASATGNGSYDQITYAYATFNNIPTEEDLDVVEEEINKITREKIGAEITLKPISIADYVNKVSLSLQGGEKIDVYQSLGNFGNCVSTDMCYDISDLIDSCAPETKALLGDKFLDACKVNGKLYGIPTYKPFALTPMFIYRKDIADELGIDMSTVNSVEDVTPILEQVKEVLLTSVGEFWLIQYRFNAIQCRVHYSQARCLAIECFQRSKQIKYEQKNAKNISQGKAAILFQKDCQPENCRNTNTIKDIQPHGPGGHFSLKGKGCISGPSEIPG